jgi:peptide/nickel transport system substrate-binding protein
VYAAFPHALNFLPILPEHVLRDVEPSAIRENAFSNAPIGSGAFTLRFIQDVDKTDGRKIIHLARNNDYYRGVPKLDRFQLHVYPTTDAVVKALNTGEVNASADLTQTDATELNDERYNVEHKPVNSGVYALLNTTSPALGDKRIRQALQLSTDTKAVREGVGKNLPELYLPFTAGQLSGDVPGAPAYDPLAAARLLDEAGWTVQNNSRQKDGQPLKLSVVTTKNNDLERALEIVAKQWRSLGITVTTNIVDPTDQSQNVVRNILQPRNYDVLLYQLAIGGDPDVYAYWHSSQVSGNGFNFSNYSNAISDDSLISARSRLEPDLRNAKYLTFARQWLSDVPAIGLYQTTVQYAYSKSVHALAPEQTVVSAGDRYANVLYWSVGDRLVHRTP